jgi:nicotinamidase/pyrazinamidase
VKKSERRTLLVVDVQNDFCSNGALAVPDGEAVVPVVNRLAARFEHIVATQDWHAPEHISFASSHPGRRPYDTVELPYGAQTLWPDHCIRGTDGAALHPGLRLDTLELIVRKGFRQSLDSYSAFYENDKLTPTGLAGYLKERGLWEIFIVGLATDFCVHDSAIDAARLGFSVHVIEDACRGIDINRSVMAAWESMKSNGIIRTSESALSDKGL